jgi:putative nucleotidyltransferase with HDIG domain
MFQPNRKPARLAQWTGRRRSSQSEEPVMQGLCSRPVLLRLAVVVLTVITMTGLASWAGMPVPYRINQICPQDVRARVYFEVIDQPQTERAREEAVGRLSPEERNDPAACERVRLAEPPVMEKYLEGTPLVQRGRPITIPQMLLLREENRAYQRSLPRHAWVRRTAAMFLVMSLLALLVVLYVVRFQPALSQSLPRVIAICALAALTMALALVLDQPPWHASLIPLTVAALMLALVYNPQFALLMAFSLSMATALVLGIDLEQLIVQTAGLATAVLLLRNVRTRTRLVEIGVGAGAAYLAMTVAAELLTGQTWPLIANDGYRRFIWGALAGFLVSGCLPLIERCFGIVTDISLRELADGSHPLLQELVCRAPGTYTHSMTVATLAEAAAAAIGANPLLARVGSYFHDVGKMLKPQYFIENQSGENRHDELEPALSTLVIIGHVKDGMALAEQYRLPRPVMDFIEQHHGTTLVEYFYHEALRLHGGHSGGHGRTELEPAFRYPGPKPQNRENGIVLLADAVESSSRTLVEPTPARLRKLIHDLLLKRLLDGQFEESGLTLTELHLVEESLNKNLVALYHARIKYPEAEEVRLAS